MDSPYKRIIVFDLETGGLKPEYNPVTEIAMTVIDATNLKIIDTYSSYIKPYMEDELYTQGAIDVNGHTKEFLLENGKDVSIVIDEIIDMFYEHKIGSIKPILAGHNIINFDIPFLENLIKRSKYKLSKFVNTLHSLDTLFFSRLRYIESPNYQLGAVCQHEDIALSADDAHGAIADTNANAELVIIMLKHLRGNALVGDINDDKEKFISYEF